MIFSDFDKKMMSLAIEQALISKSKDEVPIGSVLTKKETKQKRNLTKTGLVHESDVKSIKQQMCI